MDATRWAAMDDHAFMAMSRQTWTTLVADAMEQSVSVLDETIRQLDARFGRWSRQDVVEILAAGRAEYDRRHPDAGNIAPYIGRDEYFGE